MIVEIVEDMHSKLQSSSQMMVLNLSVDEGEGDKSAAITYRRSARDGVTEVCDSEKIAEGLIKNSLNLIISACT